jgi:hypothetical protein
MEHIQVRRVSTRVIGFLGRSLRPIGFQSWWNQRVEQNSPQKTQRKPQDYDGDKKANTSKAQEEAKQRRYDRTSE